MNGQYVCISSAIDQTMKLIDASGQERTTTVDVHPAVHQTHKSSQQLLSNPLSCQHPFKNGEAPEESPPDAQVSDHVSHSTEATNIRRNTGSTSGTHVYSPIQNVQGMTQTVQQSAIVNDGTEISEVPSKLLQGGRPGGSVSHFSAGVNTLAPQQHLPLQELRMNSCGSVPSHSSLAYVPPLNLHAVRDSMLNRAARSISNFNHSSVSRGHATSLNGGHMPGVAHAAMDHAFSARTY